MTFMIIFGVVLVLLVGAFAAVLMARGTSADKADGLRDANRPAEAYNKPDLGTLGPGGV